MRPKGSSPELEQRRRLAVSLLEQGMRPAQAARAVGTSRASVTRWRQAYQEGGPEAIGAKPHPGKPPRLTRAERRRLAKLLLRGPRKHGYSTDLWTLARVAEVIAVNFGVEGMLTRNAPHAEIKARWVKSWEAVAAHWNTTNKVYHVDGSEENVTVTMLWDVNPKLGFRVSCATIAAAMVAKYDIPVDCLPCPENLPAPHK